jgi:hypothetical protein
MKVTAVLFCFAFCALTTAQVQKPSSSLGLGLNEGSEGTGVVDKRLRAIPSPPERMPISLDMPKKPFKDTFMMRDEATTAEDENFEPKVL